MAGERSDSLRTEEREQSMRRLRGEVRQASVPADRRAGWFHGGCGSRCQNGRRLRTVFLDGRLEVRRGQRQETRRHCPASASFRISAAIVETSRFTEVSTLRTNPVVVHVSRLKCSAARTTVSPPMTS